MSREILRGVYSVRARGCALLALKRRCGFQGGVAQERTHARRAPGHHRQRKHRNICSVLTLASSTPVIRLAKHATTMLRCFCSMPACLTWSRDGDDVLQTLLYTIKMDENNGDTHA